METKYGIKVVFNTWNDYMERVKIMSELPNGLGSHGLFLFRGQSNKDWTLSTSIQRKLSEYNINTHTEAIEYEKNAEKYFLSKASTYIPEMNKEMVYWDRLSRWEFMQHYGASSRLLDWTRSPYIALYFACLGDKKTDGAIFRLSAGKLQNRQASKYKQNSDASSYYEYFIKELEKSISGEPYEKLIEIISDPFPTKRMVQQFSEFTITTDILESHNVLINKSGHFGELKLREPIIKFIVPKNKKEEYLEKLDEMDIRKETVYPILDGTKLLTRNHELIEKISYNPTT